MQTKPYLITKANVDDDRNRGNLGSRLVAAVPPAAGEGTLPSATAGSFDFRWTNPLISFSFGM